MFGTLIVAVVSLWRLSSYSEPGLWTFWLGVVVTLWLRWLAGAWYVTSTQLRALPREVTLAVDDAGCTFRSENSTTWFSWRDVRAIYRLRHSVFLLSRLGCSCSMIPVATLSEQQLASLLEQARTTGAQMR